MEEKKLFDDAFKDSIKKYEEKERLSMTEEELDRAEYEVENRNGRPITEDEKKDMQARAFGVNLARMRKAKGLSQLELAEAMGLTQSRITEYETAKKKPRARRVCEFADFFNCSITELLDISPLLGTMEDLTHSQYVEEVQTQHPGTKFITVGGCIPYERSEAYGKIMQCMENMDDYELTQFYLCAVQLLEQSGKTAPGIKWIENE